MKAYLIVLKIAGENLLILNEKEDGDLAIAGWNDLENAKQYFSSIVSHLNAEDPLFVDACLMLGSINPFILQVNDEIFQKIGTYSDGIPNELNYCVGDLQIVAIAVRVDKAVLDYSICQYGLEVLTKKYLTSTISSN